MNDFIAGSISGLSQTLVGHPFDTLKVLRQNNISYSLRDFPVKEYFRGVSYPMGFSILINSCCFGFYNIIYNHIPNHFISGSIAGGLITPFVHFQGIGKIQRQIGNQLTLYSFMTTHGVLSSFYREFFAFGTYFGTYYYLRDKNVNILLCGGIAGLANWTLTYPIDVLRNRVYAQNITMREAAMQGNIWKGYGLCASRAILVNAVGFYVYELFKDLLTKK